MNLVVNALTCEIYMHLRESVGWSIFSKEQSQAALNGDRFDVVAFSGSEAVGMGRVIGDGIYYLLVDVVVCPAYQGNGIGKAIVERIIKHISDILPTGARCSVQLVSANGKEPFYEKIGFSSIPNSKAGYGMQLFLEK